MMKATLIAALLLATCAASAQVWRCGNEYSNKPCPGGRSVDTEDTRTPEQARQSASKAQYETRVGNQMEKERIAKEKGVAGPTAIVTGQKEAAAPAPREAASGPKSAGRKKGGKKQPEHFTATAPKDPKAPAKKKAAKKQP